MVLRLGTARLGLAALVVALASASASPSFARSGAAGDCTKAAATQLVAQHDLNNFLLPDPVAQVLCGSFTGPGSVAMAVTIKAPTCWSPQRWAVFSFSGGDWKLVLDEPAFVVGQLVAVGPDIRETTPVFRSGDPRCVPSGGTHARLWHWEGTQLVAGPWTQVTPGKALTGAIFNSPTAIGTQCYLGDDPSVHAAYAVQVVCQSGRARPALAQKVKMRGNGSVTICRDRSNRNVCNLGNSGEDPVPTLGYGKQVTVGRFRCSSLRTGIKCVVIRTGKGFLINRARVTRVG